MTTRLNFRWLFVSILLFSLQWCGAQSVVIPPSLSFDLGTVDAPESQLWDLNGSYAVDLEVTGKNGLAVPVEVAFTLIQNPSGQLSTTTNEFANISIVFNNDDQSAFAGVAKISGKVTTAVPGTARVHLSIHFIGNGSLAGQSTTIKGTLTLDAETDGAGHLIPTKTAKFSADFPGLTSIKGTDDDYVMDLPPGVDGTWNMTVKLVGVNKLTGTAVVTTPLEALGLDLTGKFNGLITAKAKGATDVPNTVSGVGASGTLLIPTTFDTIQFSGKILGQRLEFNVTTAAPE